MSAAFAVPTEARADVVCVASWNADLVSHVPAPPLRGQTVLAQGFRIGPGGKGSNAAIACARQGARTAVLARIGCDAFGDMALSVWQTEGVSTQAVERVADEPSGVAQIWIYPDGDNSIAVAPGAGLGLGPAQVTAAAALLQGARVVMASCEVPVAATLAAFRVARAAGALTLLNPAPAIELPDEIWPLCQVLTPNQTELATLSGLGPDAPPAEAAAVLLQRGVGAVLVTLGADGCLLCQAGQAPRHEPGWQVADVADTVGAGDTFTGSLAAALVRGCTLPEAMRWANAAAAQSVRGHGAIAGMPRLADTAAWLGMPSADISPA